MDRELETKYLGLATLRVEGTIQDIETGRIVTDPDEIAAFRAREQEIRDLDDVILLSGRRIYANRGYIGINGDLSLCEGYDGGIDWPASGLDEDDLTAEDMRELSDLMIERWQRFKANLPATTPQPQSGADGEKASSL